MVAAVQLVYSEAELMADHPDLAPLVILDWRVHGGIDPRGMYRPPRALVRERALDAWALALREHSPTSNP